MKSFLLFGLFSLPMLLFGQTLELVADINQAPVASLSSSVPEHLTAFNNSLYFSGIGPGIGRELLRFDGTTIEVAADMNPTGSSSPRYLTEMDGTLYFITSFSSNTAMKLMEYDGVNPPQEVHDITASYSESYPPIQAYNGSIYYTVYNIIGQWELWKYNPANGASKIYENAGSVNYCTIRGMLELNGELLVYADGQGFASYDGTNLVGLTSGAAVLDAVNLMAVYNGAIYYAGLSVATGWELYKYDAANAPVLLSDINPGNASSLNLSLAERHRFAEYNGELYFPAFDGVNGTELWKTDGTDVTLVDVNPTGGSNPGHLAAYDGQLFFTGFESASGNELYTYDGTDALLVSDLNVGTASASITDPVVFDNKLYFGALDGISVAQLFEYEGSSISKSVEANENQGSLIRHLTRFQDKIFFSANGPDGIELYATDGTNTEQVVDLYPGLNAQQVPNNSSPERLFTFKDVLYFRATNINGWDMYAYDGTNQPSVSSVFTTDDFGFFEYNGELYFSSFADASVGNELWKYDGSNPPVLVADINAGSDGSDPWNFIEYNGKLVFSARDDVHGTELWEYDGVSAPTLVADLNPLFDSYPEEFAEYDGKLYFRAYADDSIGTELYVYDGMTTPQLVVDLWPGSTGGWANEGYPGSLQVVNNKLVFHATGPSGISNLWEYDGVSAPVEITNYTPVSVSNQFASMTVVNEVLYYWADAGDNTGAELYRYDGENAPEMLPELSPGAGRSRAQSPSNMIALNGYVYLNANDWVVGGPLFGVGELYRFSLCTPFAVSIFQNDSVLSVDGGYTSYQWYDDNGMIAGATSNSYQATANGTYYCEVFDGSCSAVSDSVTILNLGLEDLQAKLVQLYPNPTSDILNIQSQSQQLLVQVFSSTGALVGTYYSKAVDLSHLQTGVYAVVVHADGKVFQQRVVKF